MDVTWEHPQFTDDTQDYVLGIRTYSVRFSFIYPSPSVFQRGTKSAIVPLPITLESNTTYEVVLLRRTNDQREYYTYNGMFQPGSNNHRTYISTFQNVRRTSATVIL